MIEAANYRRRAEDCRKQAEEAGDDYHRKNFAQLAAMWTEMADKADVRGGAREVSPEQEAIDDALETIQRANELQMAKAN